LAAAPATFAAACAAACAAASHGSGPEDPDVDPMFFTFF
jgi:hypothetical protein